MSLRRPVTAVTLGFGIALTIPFLASAHTSGASATCNGITTSLQFFENAPGDRVYTSIDDMVNPVDTFSGPFVTTTHTVPVPQDGVTHAWKVVVDSVSGNGTQYDATYSGAVGPCGEVQTTTTVAETTTTELVTTTTEQEATTTVEATTTTIEATTSTIADTTTTAPEVTTTVPVTKPTTTVAESTTTVPVVTTVPDTEPTTPTTAPECVDNPATPADDCAPICVSVTLEDGSDSCSPPLPATGSESTVIMVIGGWLLASGVVAFGFGRIVRGRGR